MVRYPANMLGNIGARVGLPFDHRDPDYYMSVAERLCTLPFDEAREHIFATLAPPGYRPLITHVAFKISDEFWLELQEDSLSLVHVGGP